MTIQQIIGQQPNEKILKLLRRHPLIFIKDLALFSALALLPVVFYIFSQSFFPDAGEGEIASVVIILLGSIYYLSVLLIFLTQFTDYYLDNWIITNSRVLNIEQHALFGRTMSEMGLYKIQDVTSEIKGIIPTLFGYGEVYVQTAGKKERFIFEQIANPHQIRDMLLDLAESDRQKRYHSK